MGKGEIARYEQFLLFPHCFQKARFPGASKGAIVWEWVNGIWNSESGFPQYNGNIRGNAGRVPFTCSRMLYCVPEHCSGMLERNISAQFYCSVQNGWLVVLGFNATLTAKVISWRSVTHMIS